MFRSCCFLLTAIILAVALLACSSNGKQWDPEDYTVKSGDTVYSIAWRYEVDAEEMAAWNGLGASKLIKPGQRLHTRKPANYETSRNNATANHARDIAYAQQAAPQAVANKNYAQQKKWVKAKKGDTLYGISKQTAVSVERLAQLNQLKKPYIIQPGQTIYLKPLNTSSSKSSKTAVSSRQTGKHESKQQKTQTISWPKSVRWQKPAKGKVIKKFNRWHNDAKGIDIAGKQGDTIVASANGKVVYSGNGLINYGNLIIIKHNKTYLSAYAYNRKLLVKEGNVVKAGQKIAEMGHKDKSAPRLHFEIRKNGKPVDPLKYLPW